MTDTTENTTEFVVAECKRCAGKWLVRTDVKPSLLKESCPDCSRSDCLTEDLTFRAPLQSELQTMPPNEELSKKLAMQYIADWEKLEDKLFTAVAYHDWCGDDSGFEAVCDAACTVLSRQAGMYDFGGTPPDFTEPAVLNHISLLLIAHFKWLQRNMDPLRTEMQAVEEGSRSPRDYDGGGPS